MSASDTAQKVMDFMFDENETGPVQLLRNTPGGSFVFKSFLERRFQSVEDNEKDCIVNYVARINVDAQNFGSETALGACFGPWLQPRGESVVTRLGMALTSEPYDIPVLSMFGDHDWMDKSEAKKLGDILRT